MKLCMIGTGYVGLVSGASFADLGNTVYCVDKDQNKINLLNNNVIPIYEPGLNEIVKKNHTSGRLIFTSNIERAVKRGTGGDGGESLMEVTYEGYAPGGAAVLIQALTDNKNRTVSEVRTLFSHNNGSLAEAGSVIWNFERKGVVVVDDSKFDIETLTLKIIDAGAEDFKEEDGIIEVYTSPEDLEQVRFAIEGEGVNIASSEASMMPKTTIPVEPKVVKQALRLLEELEDIDDVQQVFTNGDFPEDMTE